MNGSAIVFLIMGSTAYLLMFKREYMIESNSRAPKIFLASVCMFAVFVTTAHLGFLDSMISI